MQLYRELGYELDKNYDYKRILSTSTGSNGSSGIITDPLFDCEGSGRAYLSCGLAREGDLIL